MRTLSLWDMSCGSTCVDIIDFHIDHEGKLWPHSFSTNLPRLSTTSLIEAGLKPVLLMKISFCCFATWLIIFLLLEMHRKQEWIIRIICFYLSIIKILDTNKLKRRKKHLGLWFQRVQTMISWFHGYEKREGEGS